MVFLNAACMAPAQCPDLVHTVELLSRQGHKDSQLATLFVAMDCVTVWCQKD